MISVIIASHSARCYCHIVFKIRILCCLARTWREFPEKSSQPETCNAVATSMASCAKQFALALKTDFRAVALCADRH